MRTTTSLLSISLIVGCAATYKAPETSAKPVSASIEAPKAVLAQATKAVLVMEGYQITAADDVAGVISTAKFAQKLSSAEVDCGTTLGIDYLKDNRTTTTVAVGAVVADGLVTLRTSVEGYYAPQATHLGCASRGVIEQRLLEKITMKATGTRSKE